jgi:hypothetical protein
VPDNIWEKMMSFFGRYANNRKGRGNLFCGGRAVSLTPTEKEKSVGKLSKILPKKNPEVESIKAGNSKISKKSSSK